MAISALPGWATKGSSFSRDSLSPCPRWLGHTAGDLQAWTARKVRARKPLSLGTMDHKCQILSIPSSARGPIQNLWESGTDNRNKPASAWVRKHVGRRAAPAHSWSQARALGLLTPQSRWLPHSDVLRGLGAWERPSSRGHPAGELWFPEAAMDLTWPG